MPGSSGCTKPVRRSREAVQQNARCHEGISVQHDLLGHAECVSCDERCINRRAGAASWTCRHRHGESWPCVEVKDQGSAMAAIEHRPRGHYSTVQTSSDRYRDQNKHDLVMTATFLLASMMRTRVHSRVQTTTVSGWASKIGHGVCLA